MNFTLEVRPNAPSPIWYETEHIRICVGEISLDREGYRLHYVGQSAVLKPEARAALRIFGEEQVGLLNLTIRMLK